MKPATTVYQDSYWNYANPFPVHHDAFEDLVAERMDHFGKRPRVQKKPTPSLHSRVITKKPTAKPAPERSPHSEPKLDESKNPSPVKRGGLRKSEPKLEPPKKKQLKRQESTSPTFVSSDTKPLRKEPRVIIHGVIPKSELVLCDVN
jgi:hypothetical protein